MTMWSPSTRANDASVSSARNNPSPLVGAGCARVARKRFRVASSSTSTACLVGASGSRPVRSTDGNCPSDGTWDFSGTNAGRIACYYSSSTTDPSTGVASTTPEFVARMWTYDQENILGWAAMAPGNTDAVALQTWWNNKAGPLQTADDVAGVVSSGSEQARFQRALRAHIPAATRKTCTSIDLSDPTASGADVYAARLWIRAWVTCRATGGAGAVVYGSIAPAAVDGFFAAFITRASAQPKTATATSDCPTSGTWSQGKGARKHVVGEFACFFHSDSSNSPEYAHYAWSHRKLGIIAQATNDNDDPSALVAWWNSSKSGPR